jgi:hypothetical protein
MLEVQKYLRTRTLDQLTDELAIKVTRHDTLPLVILNYNQIDSPKTHPVVRECRGLCLHAHTHRVVAKSFNRFFNWGEVAEEMGDFDFSDFVVQSKEDGSLVLLYEYDGQWRANTRGSFAEDNIQFQEFTWTDAICKAAGHPNLTELGIRLNPQFTYVCELCTPWNKIVRRYPAPVLYLLTIFDKEGRELTTEQCDGYASSAGLLRPTLYQFKSIEEIQSFLQEQAESDPTFEGVVIKDHLGHRWKIKSATYLGLHRLRGEGDTFNPKHLLPFILAGEEDELLTYFPEVKETFYEAKCRVLEAYIEVIELWGDHWRIEDQKEFALAIKDQSSFASILFSVRKKRGNQQVAADVKNEWREATQLILKKLFKN